MTSRNTDILKCFGFFVRHIHPYKLGEIVCKHTLWLYTTAQCSLCFYGLPLAQTSTLTGAVISYEIRRLVSGYFVPDVSQQRSGLIFYARNKNQATTMFRNATKHWLIEASSHPRRMYKVSWYCPNCRRHTTIKHSDEHFNAFLLLRHSPGRTVENQKTVNWCLIRGVESSILQNRLLTMSLNSRAQHHHMKCR